MKFVKEYWVPTTLMAVLLGFSAYLQLEMFWSPMVIDAEFWQKKLEFHMSCGPFAIRYFQNYTTLAVSHLFGICTRDAFYGVQFFLALLLGPVFYKYLRKIDFNRVWSNIGVILLATAYPILGAHFAPTHTWDDFWSYHFLLFALLAAVDRRILFVGVFFTLGLLAREQIILFYPILLMLLWWSRHKIGSLKLFSTLILPIVVFVAFRIVVFEDIDPRRWELYAFNFGNVCRTTDTLVSTIIAFGFMWMASVIGLVELRKESMQDYGRLLFWGGITATALTTAVTLLF
ncbi:MAG: hypothetical protein U9N55_01205 [candidate division Zixibacteria bacterium]|nr:hypothetical protein [candidate division Zixibacteria bacterium]